MENSQDISLLSEKVDKLSKNFDFIIKILTDPELSDEDKEFHLQTLQAQSEVDAGEGVTQSKEEFLKEMESW